MMRIRLIVLAALAITGLHPPWSWADSCDETDRMETSFGKVLSIEERIASGQIVDASGWLDEPVASFRYLKALVRVDPAPERHWTLYIRDKDYRVVDVVTEKHSTATGSAWTGRITLQGPVYFDFLATPSSGADLQVSRLVLMPAGATNPYYSVQPGAPRFLDITDQNVPVATRRIADSVGMLVGSWDNKAWCCSAVAVAPDLVLTNWHCGGVRESVAKEQYWQQSICDRTIFDFSWDKDGYSREFQCKEVVQADAGTDIALLRVVARNGGDSLRPVRSWSRVTEADEPLVVVQHPACQPKQVTQGVGCKTKMPGIPGSDGRVGADFSHVCDTMNGSSGAPVFDARYRLVGLHHRGFEREGQACDMVNKAIHAGTIADRLTPGAKTALGGVPKLEP
jgi:hypothetical protein